MSERSRSEVQHTPGPWQSNDGDEPACCRISIEKDGAILAEVLNADDFPCLADDDEIHRVDEEARANARLIAAAPALYEALKDLLDVIAADELIPETVSYIREARQALAAADGGA